MRRMGPLPMCQAVGFVFPGADGVAGQQALGATGKAPAWEILSECPELRPLPGAEMLPLFLREALPVWRDGLVQGQRARQQCRESPGAPKISVGGPHAYPSLA